MSIIDLVGDTRGPRRHADVRGMPRTMARADDAFVSRAKRRESQAEAPRVAVVVPTHGRPALLADCLACLVAQELPSGAFEIIVVDDGSPRDVHSANLRTIRQAVKERPDLRIRYWWSAQNRGPAAARNKGWRMTRAPVIAFTDDDTRPAPDWLREGLVALSGHDAVTGRVRVPVPEAPTDYEAEIGRLEVAEFVTANCFVRRGTLESIGGFDERFRMAWREDSDLQFRLRLSGARIGAAPKAVITHPIRPAKWGVSVSQQRKVMFDALLYKKYPREYRRWIRPVPPWSYYAATASLLVAAGGAVTGHKVGAAAAAAGYAGLTLAFCWRRLRETRKTPSHVLEMLATSALIPPVSIYWRIRGALRWRVLFL